MDEQEPGSELAFNYTEAQADKFFEAAGIPGRKKSPEWCAHGPK